MFNIVLLQVHEGDGDGENIPNFLVYTFDTNTNAEDEKNTAMDRGENKFSCCNLNGLFYWN